MLFILWYAEITMNLIINYNIGIQDKSIFQIFNFTAENKCTYTTSAADPLWGCRLKRIDASVYGIGQFCLSQ